ncbi:hypothetical protein LC040_02130 [Bacillus tianshenii]|nr:hypothetical protein LC040_02130 [Bacillus tianshenii]
MSKRIGMAIVLCLSFVVLFLLFFESDRKVIEATGSSENWKVDIMMDVKPKEKYYVTNGELEYLGASKPEAIYYEWIAPTAGHVDKENVRISSTGNEVDLIDQRGFYPIEYIKRSLNTQPFRIKWTENGGPREETIIINVAN